MYHRPFLVTFGMRSKTRLRILFYIGLALALTVLVALILMQKLPPDRWPFTPEEDIAETLIPSESFVKHQRSPYLTH